MKYELTLNGRVYEVEVLIRLNQPVFLFYINLLYNSYFHLKDTFRQLPQAVCRFR